MVNSRFLVLVCFAIVAKDIWLIGVNDYESGKMNDTATKNQVDLDGMQSEPGAVVRLLLIFGIVTVLTVALAWQFSGQSVAIVALLSAAVCFAGSLAGHFLAIYPRGNVYVAARLYASMGARMGFPFLLLFVCKLNFEKLFSQGMVYFVVLFYLVGLLVDLTIRMRALRMSGSVSKSAYSSSNAKLNG